MNITVNFIDFDSGDSLGSVKRSNILETLIPAFKTNTHNVFMNKRFSVRPDATKWKIEYIFHNDDITNIFIKAIDGQPLSFAQYSETQSKSDSFYLRPFQIVDVDFGFHSNVNNIHGEIGKNKIYSSTILPGELHKKRPCIILSTDGSVAQVIPLTTSKRTSSDPKRVAISHESFKNLFFRYREKDSFALIHMIQTVSANRIFPPKEKNGSYSRRYAAHKLEINDQKAIEEKLGEFFSKQALIDRTILTRQLESEKLQKAKLRDVNIQLREKLQGQELKKKELEQFIQLVGKFHGFGQDIDEIMTNFAKEVTE